MFETIKSGGLWMIPIIGCGIVWIARGFQNLEERFTKFAGWFLIVESGTIILSALLYVILFRTFEDKAILRLIRNKDNRKIRRTEF